MHAREIGEPWRQLDRIPPHETIIRVGGDVEAHAPILGHRHPAEVSCFATHGAILAVARAAWLR